MRDNRVNNDPPDTEHRRQLHPMQNSKIAAVLENTPGTIENVFWFWPCVTGKVCFLRGLSG